MDKSTWKPSSPELLAENFDEIVQAHRNVAVRFWAEWNLHCRTADEVIQKLSAEFTSIKILSFNTDLEINWTICARYQVIRVPTLIYFLDGQRKETIVGLRTEDELRELFSKWARRAD